MATRRPSRAASAEAADEHRASPRGHPATTASTARTPGEPSRTAAMPAPPPALRKHFGPITASEIATVYQVLAGLIVPKTELRYQSTFQLLVAVVLSAQATDRSVNAATRGLFTEAATPAAMAALGAQNIAKHLRGINYFKTKARHVAELSQLLLDRHQGEVPEDRAALEALPGVGRKTASVVLNTAFRHPVIAVDTHIHRVSNRLGIAVTKTPAQTEEVLTLRTPAEFLLDAHHYLILHGRYCCQARVPECWRCPVRRWCHFTPKSQDPGVVLPRAQALPPALTQEAPPAPALRPGLAKQAAPAKPRPRTARRTPR